MATNSHASDRVSLRIRHIGILGGLLALISIAVGLLLGVSIVSKASNLFVNTSSNFSQDSTLGRREAIRDEWLKSASFVASITQDTEAKAVFSFLSSKAVLALPDRGNTVKPDPNASNASYYILPTLKADEDKDGWHRREDVRYEPSFVKNLRLIVIPNRGPYSEFWQGLLLLNSGRVAKNSERQTYEPDYWDAQLESFYFRIRLLRQAGGSNYQDILNSQIDNIKAEASRTGDVMTALQPNPIVYPSALDNVFGAALSQDEISSRSHVYWVDVICTFLDLYYHDEYKPKEEYKKDFLIGLYMSHSRSK